MFTQQVMDYFKVDDTMKKIEHECELDEMCEEECDDEWNSESELEDDRCLLCSMFDGWAHCVCLLRW